MPPVGLDDTVCIASGCEPGTQTDNQRRISQVRVIAPGFDDAGIDQHVRSERKDLFGIFVDDHGQLVFFPDRSGFADIRNQHGFSFFDFGAALNDRISEGDGPADA